MEMNITPSVSNTNETQENLVRQSSLSVPIAKDGKSTYHSDYKMTDLECVHLMSNSYVLANMMLEGDADKNRHNDITIDASSGSTHDKLGTNSNESESLPDETLVSEIEHLKTEKSKSKSFDAMFSNVAPKKLDKNQHNDINHDASFGSTHDKLEPISHETQSLHDENLALEIEHSETEKSKSKSCDAMLSNVARRAISSTSDTPSTILALRHQLDRIAEEGENQDEELALWIDNTLPEVKSNLRRRNLRKQNVLDHTEPTPWNKKMHCSRNNEEKRTTERTTDIEKRK